MPVTNPIVKALARKRPAKPSKKFPLFAHPSGQWAKKIRKKLVYFGSWRQDPKGEEAEKRFDREWPYLKNGDTPPAVDIGTGCTLRQLANEFLRSKNAKLKAGELSARSFRDYFKTCEMLIGEFGKDRLVRDLRPDDFRRFRSKLAERFNMGSLKNHVNRVCIVFNFAHENSLIDKPVTYGQEFDRPSAKALRKERQEAGAKLFTRAELRQLLGCSPYAPVADVPTVAMILLGLNCGFGNTDVASLPQSALNLKNGWVTFPRPKTAIERRCPLWPETVAALQAAIACRPVPLDPADDRLCFLTDDRLPLVRVQIRKEKEPAPEGDDKRPEHIPIDVLAGRFGKLLKKLGINGRRGLGFYTLRHCFETYAGESKDQVAVDAIMGHVDSTMAGNYRQGISDDRLKAVVETVRNWLFAATQGSAPAKGGAA